MKPELVMGALAEDLAAFQAALENDNFEGGNIFANRFMSNALLVGDKPLMVPGFLLKSVAGHLIRIERSSGSVSTARSSSQRFAEKVVKRLGTKGVNLKGIWDDYVSYYNAVRKYLMNEEEQEAYKESKAFARAALDWCLEFLKERGQLLLDAETALTKGVLNELKRIFRVHGADKPSLIGESLITALDRVLDYHIQAYSDDPEVFQNRVKEEVLPLVDEITGLFTSDEEVDEEIANRTLGKLVARWREFFIEYMEKPRLVATGPPTIEVPDEAKEKVAETITKAIESEVRKS